MDKRYFRYFDWFSFIITVLLSCIGLLFVFSATYRPDQPYSIFFKKQVFGICSGFILYFILCITDYRSLARLGYWLYWCVIGILALTLIKGSMGMGAQRWINLGFIRFQPSELAKLFLPPFITYHFYHYKDIPDYSFKDFFPIVASLAISCVLILKQPDLGTSLLVAFSGIVLLWILGLDKKFFLGGLLLVTCSTPILWKFLKPYQRQRIIVFLGGGDKQKERYQLEQSKIAIGSGGLAGKGFLRGTQNQLLFLPESRTDFIFSVIGEEWGFIGSIAIVMLYTLLYLRILYVIGTLKHFYAQVLALGLVAHCIISTIINISMVLGMLPIVGIPLPLISYGITHTWITLMSLGWINGIFIRRFYIGE